MRELLVTFEFHTTNDLLPLDRSEIVFIEKNSGKIWSGVFYKRIGFCIKPDLRLNLNFSSNVKLEDILFWAYYPRDYPTN